MTIIIVNGLKSAVTRDVASHVGILELLPFLSKFVANSMANGLFEFSIVALNKSTF